MTSCVCVLVLGCDLVSSSLTGDFSVILLASEYSLMGQVSSVAVGFSASDTSSLSEAEVMSFNYPVMVTLYRPQGPFQSQS